MDAWTVIPWLAPQSDVVPAPVPALDELGAVAAEAVSSSASQREIWFMQILPLMEAMVLSAAAQALKNLPDDWYRQSSYARWLHGLLVHEGLCPPD